jgi:hypothetical protein
VSALAVYGEHLVALAELDLEVGMRLGELLNAIWGHEGKRTVLESAPASPKWQNWREWEGKRRLISRP